MVENSEASSKKETVAVAEKPEVKVAPQPEEKPLNTDVFETCTKRCTRRAWDFFLSVRNEIDLFKTKTVRGHLTFKSASSAQQALTLLVNEGGVTEVTERGEALEFTGSLAAVQLVLRSPDTVLFDALKIE